MLLSQQLKFSDKVYLASYSILTAHAIAYGVYIVMRTYPMHFWTKKHKKHVTEETQTFDLHHER